METYSIAVFDVCGTITRTNNTSDFIGFVLRRDSVPKYCLFVLVRLLGLLRGFFRLRSVGRRDRPRDWQIALLRGCSCARLRELSSSYVDALFAKGLLHTGILEAMKREREQGRALFLISAAVDPPIVEMARRFGAQGCFSSELETVDGWCTGRLKTDLLGNKRSVLDRIPGTVDWGDSSVYSDNLADAEFMEGFGRRNVVLNAGDDERLWQRRSGEFRFIVVRPEPARWRDTDSVSRGTVRWTYVPFLYYLVSRFHWQGLGTPVLRELVPVSLATWLFTDLGMFSFVLMPLSLLMFYCVYEIGGLVNDLHAGREPPGRGTRRIAPGVHVHVGLFVAIRAAVIVLLLTWLPISGYAAGVYAAALGLCLAVYLVHTLLSDPRRVITFTLLKLCKSVVPLLILVSRVPPAALLWLCVVFFAVDAPWRVWMYCRAYGLTRRGVSVERVRCVDVAMLWGLGAVIWLVARSPLLLAITSYYVLLECLWVVRAVLLWEYAVNRNWSGEGHDV